MTISKNDVLLSALTEFNPLMKTDDFYEWFEERKQAHQFRINIIPFKEMDQWGFEPTTGNLFHYSGKFFKIEGIWVETNYGYETQWSQPVINQSEIGILGIIVKKIDGVLYLLMQAKMEPGNINMIQLAPTLQATRSNFTRVHKGRMPPYLEYFQDMPGVKTVIDILQSEQGARFFKKRNRNIIVEIDSDIPVKDDYCWLSLGQIQKIMKQDNLVNMDARTVLSCLDFADEIQTVDQLSHVEEMHKQLPSVHDSKSIKITGFKNDLLKSFLDNSNGLYFNDEIISWFTRLKFRYDLLVEKIPMKYLKDWKKTETSISHIGEKFFSVIAARVEADNREVGAWTQPLVQPREEGIVAFITKKINGVLHFLIQGKVEPGNFDVVEMAPTVQCLTGSYRKVLPQERPPYLDYVLNASSEKIRYIAKQSEEGGRFFREQNLNMVIETDETFSTEVPENYIWMTASQVKIFIKYNNFVNVQARCLLSCLGFI
jgi:oxidase EvaA